MHDVYRKWPGSSNREPGKCLLWSRATDGDGIVVVGKDWRILGAHVGNKSSMFILELEEQFAVVVHDHCHGKTSGVSFGWNLSLPSFLFYFLLSP